MKHQHETRDAPYPYIDLGYGHDHDGGEMMAFTQRRNIASPGKQQTPQSRYILYFISL